MVFIRKLEPILIDEPSAGLGPLMVKKVMKTIKNLKEMYSTTILMVEQHIIEGLKINDFVFSMERGKIVDHAVLSKNMI
ncbi:MAG: hypothetical protein ABIM98_06895 [candidate division WOR-3 bacterium]